MLLWRGEAVQQRIRTQEQLDCSQQSPGQSASAKQYLFSDALETIAGAGCFGLGIGTSQTAACQTGV